MAQVILLNGTINGSQVMIVLPDSGENASKIDDKDLPDPYQFLEPEERQTTGSDLMDKLIDLLP